MHAVFKRNHCSSASTFRSSRNFYNNSNWRSFNHLDLRSRVSLFQSRPVYKFQNPPLPFHLFSTTSSNQQESKKEEKFDGSTKDETLELNEAESEFVKENKTKNIMIALAAIAASLLVYLGLKNLEQLKVDGDQNLYSKAIKYLKSVKMKTVMDDKAIEEITRERAAKMEANSILDRQRRLRQLDEIVLSLKQGPSEIVYGKYPAKKRIPEDRDTTFVKLTEFFLSHEENSELFVQHEDAIETLLDVIKIETNYEIKMCGMIVLLGLMLRLNVCEEIMRRTNCEPIRIMKGLMDCPYDEDMFGFMTELIPFMASHSPLARKFMLDEEYWFDFTIFEELEEMQWEEGDEEIYWASTMFFEEIEDPDKYCMDKLLDAESCEFIYEVIIGYAADCLSNGFIKEGLEYLEKARIMDPSFDSLYLIADILEENDQHDAAIEFNLYALQQSPADESTIMELMEYLSEVVDETENFDKECEYHIKIIALAERLIPSLYCVAVDDIDMYLKIAATSCERLQDYKSGYEFTKIWTQYNGNAPYSYFHHGKFCFKLGNFNEAERAFLTAIQLSRSAEPIFHYALARVYIEKKQYDLARAIFDNIENRLHEIHQEKEDELFAKGIWISLKAPKYIIDLKYFRALMDSYENKIEESKRGFQDLIKEIPSTIDGYFGLGTVLYEKEKNEAEGLKQFKRVVEIWQKYCEDQDCREFFRANERDRLAMEYLEKQFCKKQETPPPPPPPSKLRLLLPTPKPLSISKPKPKPKPPPSPPPQDVLDICAGIEEVKSGMDARQQQEKKQLEDVENEQKIQFANQQKILEEVRQEMANKKLQNKL